MSLVSWQILLGFPVFEDLNFEYNNQYVSWLYVLSINVFEGVFIQNLVNISKYE